MIRKAFIVVFLASVVLINGAYADSPGYDRIQALSLQVDEIRSAAAGSGTAVGVASKLVGELTKISGHITTQASAAAVDAPLLRLGTVSVVKIDFILAQLRMQMGANYHLQLRRALPTVDAPTLFVRGGRFTLRQLAESSKAVAPKALVGTGKIYTTNIPIIVWSDAQLLLEPGDELELEDEHGAFLFNAGLLRVDGASIHGSGSINSRQDKFKGFVTTALSGAFEASNARFADLGFSGYAAMEGVSIIGGALFPSRSLSYVTDSTFDAVGSLSIHNIDNIHLRGNVFRSMQGPAIELSGAKGAKVLGNVLIDTKRSQAISLKASTTDVDVAGNIIIDTAKSGILVANGSSGIRLVGNLISGSRLGGINLLRAACVTVIDNVLFHNRQAGVRVRQSAGVNVLSNLLADNAGPGLALMQQLPGSPFTVGGNDFLSNRSGLYGASMQRVTLKDNDFSAQLPIILDGEFAQRMPQMLREQNGLHSVAMTLLGESSTGLANISGISPYALQNCNSGSRT